VITHDEACRSQIVHRTCLEHQGGTTGWTRWCMQTRHVIEQEIKIQFITPPKSGFLETLYGYHICHFLVPLSVQSPRYSFGLVYSTRISFCQDLACTTLLWAYSADNLWNLNFGLISCEPWPLICHVLCNHYQHTNATWKASMSSPWKLYKALLTSCRSTHHSSFCHFCPCPHMGIFKPSAPFFHTCGTLNSSVSHEYCTHLKFPQMKILSIKTILYYLFLCYLSLPWLTPDNNIIFRPMTRPINKHSLSGSFVGT